MASVKRRPDGKWRARWRDPDGKEHARHFTRKRDADAFLATVEADKLRGQYVDPTDRTSVSAYAWRWAAARPHGPRTARKLASTLRNHVDGTKLGPRRLATVLPSDAQAWVTDRSKVLAPSTLRNVVYTVSSVFKAAALDRLIGATPFVNLALPEDDQPRIVPLTVAQVRAIADRVPARCRAMVIVQAGLGLRIGELMALRVQDVDFLRRNVRVETQIPPDERERDDPKTPRSKRELPLPQFVVDELAAHIAAFPPIADGSLFYNSYGNLWTTSHYGKVFGGYAAAAGAPEGTTSHDLRHHYASVLLHAGESVVAVADRLGHKNANLVLKVYGHLMPDSEERTRKALDAAWGPAAAAPLVDRWQNGHLIPTPRGQADQVRTSGSSRAV